MNKFLDDSIEVQVREAFSGMKEKVMLVLFTSKEGCVYCEDTRQLLEEVSAISPKISLEIMDLLENKDQAEHYKIDKAPGLVILAQNESETIDYGIRFYGIPAGHEFSTLIQDILMVSNQASDLDEKTREFLNRLDQPLHLQVFVTPTCPYCPPAAIMAHRMAMENPLITAEAVEASEYPDLANRFNVSGVPHTVINAGAGNVVGAVPLDHLVAEIEAAIK